MQRKTKDKKVPFFHIFAEKKCLTDRQTDWRWPQRNYQCPSKAGALFKKCQKWPDSFSFLFSFFLYFLSLSLSLFPPKTKEQGPRLLFTPLILLPVFNSIVYFFLFSALRLGDQTFSNFTALIYVYWHFSTSQNFVYRRILWLERYWKVLSGSLLLSLPLSAFPLFGKTFFSLFLGVKLILIKLLRELRH